MPAGVNKELLKEAVKIATRKARDTGRDQGIYQRDDSEEHLNVCSLKYGPPNDRFSWTRIASITESDQSTDE